jgi:formylglycine-generating enzyme required for sulfatase activity
MLMGLKQKNEYELVMIPGGRFQMGSPDKEEARWKAEGPLRTVEVPDFFLGKYPVTNEEYGRFLKANPRAPYPEYWYDRQYNQPRQPVVGVSWDEARRYCEWAGLRLPSEAEWEYACRAGTTTRYYSGDLELELFRVGWCDGNSDGRSHLVGEKEPNGLGLYDMHGNVWEWCEDDWHDNYKGAPCDGTAWVSRSRAERRVYRGGSWDLVATFCRSAFRAYWYPGNRSGNLGFRPAMS